MKLLIITCLQEHQPIVAQHLQAVSIPVFSVTNTTGFKKQEGDDLLQQWFSRGTDRVDAVVVFSFTTDDKARAAVAVLDQHNVEHPTGFPIHAFVVPVEQTTSVG